MDASDRRPQPKPDPFSLRMNPQLLHQRSGRRADRPIPRRCERSALMSRALDPSRPRSNSTVSPIAEQVDRCLPIRPGLSRFYRTISTELIRIVSNRQHACMVAPTRSRCPAKRGPRAGGDADFCTVFPVAGSRRPLLISAQVLRFAGRLGRILGDSLENNDLREDTVTRLELLRSRPVQPPLHTVNVSRRACRSPGIGGNSC